MPLMTHKVPNGNPADAEFFTKDAQAHRHLCKGCGKYYRQKIKGRTKALTKDS